MKLSEAKKLLKGRGQNDYNITVELYTKLDDGRYHWKFNWIGGGWNTVWAKTEAEAYRVTNASTGLDLKAEKGSFEKLTDRTYDSIIQATRMD